MSKLFDDDNLCNEEFRPGFITRVGWDVNIKSTQEDEFLVRCVGSLNWKVKSTIPDSSYDVFLTFKLKVRLKIKITKTAVKKGWFVKIVSRFSSKFFRKASKSSWDWLGERYKIMKLNNFSPILILKLMYPCIYWMSNVYYLQQKKMFIVDDANAHV